MKPQKPRKVSKEPSAADLAEFRRQWLAFWFSRGLLQRQVETYVGQRGTWDADTYRGFRRKEHVLERGLSARQALQKVFGIPKRLRKSAASASRKRLLQ